MNKQELINQYGEFLTDYSLTPNQAVVGAGGVLCLLGLRDETRDIDVDVPEDIFQRFLDIGLPTHVFETPGRPGVLAIEVTPSIDVHQSPDTDPVMTTEGVVHYTPKAVLAFKQTLNREKDQEDIRRLKAFLGI